MEQGVFEVEGCPIAWCADGERGRDPLVLLHGMRANRHWWDAVVEAGLGSDRRRVVAIDLSGHGESGRRSAYTPDRWGNEAAGAIEACAGGSASLVGHSMGGLVAVVAAARHPELVTDLILVETSIRIPAPGEDLVPRGTPPKKLRSFPSRRAALDAFRLFPPQSVDDPSIELAMAESSIRTVPGGWGWKFDPPVAQRFNDDVINRHLSLVACPVAMVYGGCSALVSSASPLAADQILGRRVPATVNAGGHHHVILDSPRASADAIRRSLGRT